MNNLKPNEIADLVAFIIEEEDHYPRLSDLTYWWDTIPPDALDPKLPNYSQRTWLLASYMNWSHTKHWAQEGLRQLLSELLKRRVPIPEILQSWAIPHSC